MGLTLYYMGISHPSNAARLMLDYKGLAYRRVDVRPGFQPSSRAFTGSQRSRFRHSSSTPPCKRRRVGASARYSPCRATSSAGR